MSFTDTHTHLYLKQFNDDIDSVIENSISSNVNRLFLPAINSAHTESMFLLKERYPENIFLMIRLEREHAVARNSRLICRSTKQNLPKKLRSLHVLS